jgi:hypothetical protein
VEDGQQKSLSNFYPQCGMGYNRKLGMIYSKKASRLDMTHSKLRKIQELVLPSVHKVQAGTLSAGPLPCLKVILV